MPDLRPAPRRSAIRRPDLESSPCRRPRASRPHGSSRPPRGRSRCRPSRSPGPTGRRRPHRPGPARRHGRRDRRGRRSFLQARDRSEPGASAAARNVLISETASAPPSTAASAIGTGSATFGVSFTSRGFSVSGRTRRSSEPASSGDSPTIRPDFTLGQETFSSRAATSSRPPTPSTRPANSSWLVPITETTSGTGSSASSGRSRDRKPSRPLFGSPIELISPEGVSQRRGGGLPARGSGVIVFETKAENGNSSSSRSPNARRAAIASNVPEPLMTGWRRVRPQNSVERSGSGRTVPLPSI